MARMKPPQPPVAEPIGVMPGPGESVTARVAIEGRNSENGQPCSGTITVVVDGQATIDEILQAAIDYVNGGGIRWGGHGSAGCVAAIAILEAVSRGAIPDPAVRITGTSPV